MDCQKDTGYDFIEVENIREIRTIHVHVRHAIFAPYVIHLIKKYLNI